MANTIDDKINSYIQANPQLRTLSKEKILSVMVENGVLSEEEAQKISAFAKTAAVDSTKGITVERTGTTPQTAASQSKVEFTEEQAQDFSIDMIADNAMSAESLLNDIHNGVITQGYDNLKNLFNTELSSDNVREIIDYEKSSSLYLLRAKNGTLTKRDYIKENKGRISDMLLARLEREDKESGKDFIDTNRGDIPREDYKQLLQKEIDRRINLIRNIEDLKTIQLQITALTDEEEEKLLKNLATSALANGLEKPKDMAAVVNFEMEPLEDTVPAEELMDFETTFRYERDTEYSKQYMENLAMSKGKLNFATGAYNKTQILKNKVKEMEDNYAAATKVYISQDSIATGGHEPSPEARADEAGAFFTDYYKAKPENAYKDLSAIIEKHQLDIKLTLDEEGNLTIDYGERYQTDYDKNRALNTLLKVAVQEQEKKLNEYLGGQPYENYLADYQNDYKYALGERNATAMAEALKEDQLTVIDNTTGVVSLAGIGVMAIGGILTLTPAAPTGLFIIGLGGKIALAGMASHHILGFSDEFTKDEQSQERLNRMYKDLALDLGGLIIGGAAGRQGLKFASQFLRNGGNKAVAIVIEKGTDFTLSAAGDLAMIGALNYDQTLEQTLKSNGIGILVSTVTGIKASKELFKSDFPTDFPETRAVTSRTTESYTPGNNMDYAPATEFAPQTRPALTPAESRAIPEEQGVTVINPAKLQAEEKQKLDEACTVNGEIKPELLEAAEKLKQNGTTNGGAAEIINKYKDADGNVNPAVFEIGEKLKAAKISASPAMIDACLKPDGSINENAIETAIELKNSGATIFGLPSLLKVSLDADGNYSKELFEKYVQPLSSGLKSRYALDGAGRILEQCLKGDILDETLYSKALELSTKNYDTPTITNALKSAKDAAGNFNEHNYALTSKLLDAGIKQDYLNTITGLAKKDGIIDENIINKALQLKGQNIKDFNIADCLKSATDKDGNFSDKLFAKLEELMANPATKDRASWIMTASKNNDGEFVEQNYKAIKFLFENLPRNQQKNIQSIIRNSMDENGNINKTYFTKTLKLFSQKFSKEAITLIMRSCAKKDANGNPIFANDLYDRTMAQAAELVKEGKTPAAEISLSVNGQKVVMTCKYEDSSTRTRKFDFGLTTLKTTEESQIQTTTKEKVRVTKSHDIDRNISTRTTQALDKTGTVLNEVNVIRDKDGNILRTEYYSQSDVPGILDVRIKTPDGRTTVISSGKVDPETGYTLIEKNMESLDGTVTQYRYEDDPQGNRIIDYRITDKDGNVLMNDSQTFEVISENRMISSYNDNVYEITLDGNQLTVNGKTTGEQVVFELDTYLSDTSNKEMLLNLLKQMPGHELISLNKKTKKLSSTSEKIASVHKVAMQEIVTANDLSILLHEAGHSKHAFGMQEVEFNENFIKIFNEEREAFIKAFPDQQQKHIEYFINDRMHLERMRKQGTYEETIAETNSLLNTYYHSPELQIRAQYLQQYFPRTIAELSKIMQSKDTQLATPTGKKSFVSHAALTPEEFNQKLTTLNKEEFTNEIIDFVVTLRRKNNETVTDEEIAEYRNSEEIDEIYTLYEKIPEAFAILMKKDANGEYHNNSNKADFMMNAFNDYDMANPQTILDNVQFAEKCYNYFDNPEKYPIETLGLGERQLDYFKQLESAISDRNDTYTINNIIEEMSVIKDDRNFDYAERLEQEFNMRYQYERTEIIKNLETDAEREILNKILAKTGKFESYYTNVIKMTNEFPEVKTRIENLLKQDDINAISRELNDLRSLRGNKWLKERAYLLNDERLSANNIQNLCYLDKDDYETRVLNRGLLEDKTLTGNEIVYLGKINDAIYNSYQKLVSTNLSKEDAVQVLQYNYGLSDLINENEFLLNMNLTKEDWNYISNLTYGSSIKKFKARRELHNQNQRLSLKERVELSDRIDDRQYCTIIERGLLNDESLDANQIIALANINDDAYKIAVERDIVHNHEDLSHYIMNQLIQLDDSQYANYMQIKNHPTENMQKRNLSTQEKIELAKYPKETIEKFDAFLYFENRKNNQFPIRNIEQIFLANEIYDVTGTGYKKFSELANYQKFAEQNQSPLHSNEIFRLMDLDESKLPEVMKLLTYEERNAVGERISAMDAIDLYNTTIKEVDGKMRTPEARAEQEALLKKLLFIPERRRDQIEGRYLNQIMVQLGSVENFKKYENFIFNAGRDLNNLRQWNGGEIYTHIIYTPDEWLPKAESLMYIAERGKNQFSPENVRALAGLNDEEFNIAIKYIKNPKLSTHHIKKIVEQPEEIRQKIDNIIEYKTEHEIYDLEKAAIEVSCMDGECYNNFMHILANADRLNLNQGTMMQEFAELKGDKFKQLTELLEIEKAKDQKQYFKDIASLDEVQYTKAKQLLEAGYEGRTALIVAKCKDPDILDKYNNTIEEAKKKRNQLKSGVSDLTDFDINNFFRQNMEAIIQTIDLVGVSVFTHSYTSKLNGVESFVESVRHLRENLSDEEYSALYTKINDKSLEPQEKIAKLRTLGAILQKYDSSAEKLRYINLIKPNKPTKEEVQRAKAIWANPKAKFDDKLNEFCETFGLDKNNKKVLEFFNKRAQTNAKGYKILNSVKEAELSKLLEIEVVRKRNEHEWNTAIDQKVYESIGITYSPELSKRLNLSSNKYLSTFFHANSGFKENFGEMVDYIVANPDKSIREIFDELPQNIETRRQFEEYGIDYDKWVAADKNSYKIVNVESNVQQSRQAAIANLEADLNDPDFKKIPEEETGKIFKALEEIGISAKTKKEPCYDENGFIHGYEDVTRLYAGDKPITFNKLEKALSAIKQVINENDFWTKTNSDPGIDQARTTIYNHIMKLRDAEIDAAANLKDNEVATLEVHKTDMNNIAHSLFLGNHAGCCTAVGSSIGNDYAAPRYIMDKCISAIEVMDGNEFVGNTMCYFAEVDGKLALVLDNIEMNTKYQNNNEIRDVFMEYAQQLCEEVGKPDLPIYAGPYRHKFNMTPYQIDSHDIKIIGSTDGETTYIDFNGHYIIDGQRVSRTNLYKIR